MKDNGFVFNANMKKRTEMTAEDIVRELYGNDYTLQELDRIKEALEEQYQEWRKRNFN
ncbi:hypothetical protein [Pediococcus pentosaceus]|uniref:hypothetical protein n=1 Tax=Pediococcus pentosaceus TaxID=1255 RepID=UPI0021A5E043|nr:hypothetical protein [Pediococcus pentosaceus]